MARQTGANVPADIVIYQPFASDFGSIGSRLMDFDAFFGGTHKIARLELVHRDDIAASRIEFFKRQLAIQNQSHLSVSLTGVEFGGPVSHLRDGTPIVDWRNLAEDTPMTGDLAFKFADALNEPRPTASISIPVVYSLGTIQGDASRWIGCSL